MPLRAVAGSPEFCVAVFALLLNFPWEILHVRLFAGMASAPYAEAIEGAYRPLWATCSSRCSPTGQ